MRMSETARAHTILERHSERTAGSVWAPFPEASTGGEGSCQDPVVTFKSPGLASQARGRGFESLPPLSFSPLRKPPTEYGILVPSALSNVVSGSSSSGSAEGTYAAASSWSERAAAATLLFRVGASPLIRRLSCGLDIERAEQSLAEARGLFVVRHVGAGFEPHE